MKTINYFTEKGGVSPSVRSQVKAQALEHIGLDLTQAEKVGDVYHFPIAIDELSGDTLYLKLTASVGKMTETKSKKTKTPTEPVVIPDLFD